VPLWRKDAILNYLAITALESYIVALDYTCGAKAPLFINSSTQQSTYSYYNPSPGVDFEKTYNG